MGNSTASQQFGFRRLKWAVNAPHGGRAEDTTRLVLVRKAPLEKLEFTNWSESLTLGPEKVPWNG